MAGVRLGDSSGIPIAVESCLYWCYSPSGAAEGHTAQ